MLPQSTYNRLLDATDDDMNAMLKVDNEYLKEHDSYLYWDTHFMMTRIKHSMEEECNFILPNEWNTLWYSLRLKFTDDTIRNEALLFLNGDICYIKEIYGYRIYDVMKKYKISYPVALLKIYELKNNGIDKSGFTLKRKTLDLHAGMLSRKIENSYLDKNGKIIYTEPVIKTQEEIEKDYIDNKVKCDEIMKKWQKRIAGQRMHDE